MKNSRVISNVFYLTLVQFANYVAPLFVLPYLSRVIGIEGVGVVVIVLSISALGVILTDFGFAVSSPAWIAQNSENRTDVSNYFTNVCFIKIFLIIIACILYLIYCFFDETILPTGKTSLIILAIIITQGFQMTWIFQGLEKMKHITICTIVTKSSYLLLVLMFVTKNNGVNTTLICFLISNILSTMIGFMLIRKERIYFQGLSFSMALDIFKKNIPFFFSRVAVGVYTNASTFVVGNFSGVHQAALYSGAEKLYQGIVSLSAPISQALYPHLAKTRDVKLLIKVMVFLSPFMALGVGVCTYYSREILILIYGNSFAAADKILTMFIITSVISIVSINFGYPAYSTIGRLDIVNKSVLLGGLLQFLFLMMMYFTNNINGLNVVISIFLIETVIFIFRLVIFFMLYKRLRENLV